MFRAFWGAASRTDRWAGMRARVLLASIIEGIIKMKVCCVTDSREFSCKGSGVAENSDGESEFRNSPSHPSMIESRQIKLNDHSTATMSEEPLFDSSFKKKSKKKVAFSEDPLGVEADPTQPAPDVIDNRTTNGEAVDMGPTTAHEQIAKQQSGEADDDLNAMFRDVKKKKKPKKEIPLDLVRVLASSIPVFI
jgi:hypothetical protein